MRSWEFLKEEYTKDVLYYIMNGFEDVTEEMNKLGFYVKGEISSWSNYTWEMNGCKYESWNKHIYRKKLNK